MKHFILFTLPLIACLSQAGTFVGNGGNAGDLELEVALKQIKETYLAISKETSNENLCVCVEGFEGHGVCDSLKNLTPAQARYCTDFLRTQAPQILSLLSDKSNSRFTWTHLHIDVENEGATRAADAVTDPKLGRITINQSRFLELKAYERVFLLTHELLHLTPWKKSLVTDEEKIGPFETKNGGRQLLNSVGAATVIQSYEYGITQKYVPILKRSQGHKQWSFSYSGTSLSPGENATTWSMDKGSGQNLSGRYFFANNFGVIADFRSVRGEKTVAGTIDVVVVQNALGAGGSYRYFPFRDPLSYWGQSHLILDVKVESLKSKVTLTEAPLEDSESVSSTALTVGSSYYMPIRYGFWFFGGVEYLTHRYKYATLTTNGVNTAADKNQVMTKIGVSYAF